jgi:hypothetical protein
MVWFLHFPGNCGNCAEVVLRRVRIKNWLRQAERKLGKNARRFACLTLKFMKMSSIYQINKGINKPIEFNGLHGQYIAYLAVGLVFLLLCFAALYILRVPLVLVVPLILGLGTGLYFVVTGLSKRFGVHGLSKFMARRGLPGYLKFRSRKVFTGLKVVKSVKRREA